MKNFSQLCLALILISLVLPVSAFGEVTRKLVFIGDSLTEGYGVAKDEAFPSLVEAQLKKFSKKSYIVVNSGISGSTTASGLRRMKWVLKSNPYIVIIALGANDGLRGFPPKETRKNLEQMIELALKNKVKVVLTGMLAPPNYGKKYTGEFKEIFTSLKKKFTDILFIPFLLEGVAGETKLNQADGIHPNEDGHKVIAENIFRAIKGVL